MTDQSLVRWLRMVAALGALLAVISSVMTITLEDFRFWFSKFDAFMALFAVFFAVFVWLVASRQPRNAVVWTMAASAFFGGLTGIGWAAAGVLIGDAALLEGTVVPATLPSDAAWSLALTGWGWVGAILPLLTFGLLLFPDGRVASPGWRWVGVLSAVGILATAAGSAWSYRPWSTAPIEEGPLISVGWSVVVVAAALSIMALVGRFRKSEGETRQQFKWILWGASIFLLVFMGAGSFVFTGSPNENLLLGPVMVAEAVFLVSYGIAVGKYRLYDIDVVISRTFVYGTLAIFITTVYVGAVVGMGELLGGGDEPNPILAIGATTVVAVAFQPLRRRLQRVANRVVYGRRSTPYEVLSTFSQRVGAVDPDVLAQIAKALVQGTTAESAAVWMTRGSEMQLMASWPADPETPRTVVPLDEVPSADRRARVVHDGEQLGLLTLTLPAGQPFPTSDVRLLNQVAGGLGLALRNLRLTEDLRTRLDQLRESRRRIVAIQDLTRRRLERDVHDGAQQRLVALKIKLGIGVSMAEKAGLDDVRDALDALRAEADEAIDSVRDFARGIYPPLLESEGLVAALSAHARKMPLPVTIQAAGIGRYSREAEATVYFCVLEAVQNARKHSEAKSVLVSLEESDGQLRFEVRDDGVGFETSPLPPGGGLANLADRIHSLDGGLEIVSSQGRGATIRGFVPIQLMVTTT